MADEEQTLAEAGIASINLGYTASNVNLGNGNVMSGVGTFTRTDGSAGTVGEFTTSTVGNLDLTDNPFYREFTDAIPLTAEAAALPGLRGSGAVRDLQEAASLNAALVADVQIISEVIRVELVNRDAGAMPEFS